MKKRLIGLLLVAAMLVSMLAGCGNPADKETTAAPDKETTGGTEAPGTDAPTDEPEVDYDDLPTLNILFVHGYTYQSDDNVVWREVAKKVGAKINIIGADTDKYNTMLVSGEGYDIIMSARANMKSIAEGGSLLALDDLLEEKGPNILKNEAGSITKSKTDYSDESGALYWLRYELAHNSERVAAIADSSGQIRWDLYKEMGYPEINSMDDFLLMLKDMQELYPKNADGKSVYAIAIPSDKWDISFYSPFYIWRAEKKSGTTTFFTTDGMNYVNRFEDEGVFWDAIEFYRKAYKLGILDPDSFAMTEEEMKAKATDGRLLYITASYQTGKLGEGQGFMTLPRSWGKSVAATEEPDLGGKGNFPAGFAINKKTEMLDECMKFLDFIHSEEGANLIYNGIEDVHYTVENGVRVPTQKAIDMWTATEGEEWEKTGLYTAETSHFCALAAAGIASDGKPMFLMNDNEIRKATMTDVQKDFCDYYGVTIPMEAQIQLQEKNDMGEDNYDRLVASFLPTGTDDTKRIEAALMEYAESISDDLIHASDAEYEALVAEVKAEFKSLGLDTLMEYYETHWDEAYDKAEAFLGK